jgi:hypothetical protein
MAALLQNKPCFWVGKVGIEDVSEAPPNPEGVESSVTAGKTGGI